MKAALVETAVWFAPVMLGISVCNVVAKQGVLLQVANPNEAVTWVQIG